MFDIVNFNLASDIADNGTVTLGYPTGRSKDDYSLNSALHVLFIGQNEYAAPADFTLTFNANASGITLTNKSGATWTQGTACGVQIERAGSDTGSLELSQVIKDAGRVTPVLPVFLNLGSPVTADADGVCASQSIASAAAGLINGALASGGVVVLDVPRNIVAAWTTTAILTITGEDEYGVVIVEKSASGTSHTGKKAFKKITSVSPSVSITGATVGTGEKLGLPLAVHKAGQIVGEFKNGQLVGRGSPAITRINWGADQVSVLAGTTSALELISPISGTISKLAVAVRAAVGTGGAVTVKVGTTDVTGLSITVADSATKGTTATDTPTTPGDASTVVAKGDRIQIVFADAFATTGALDGYLEITPTDDAAFGTFVAADSTEATGTTGDVRGTYTPADASDGSTGARLLTVIPTPNDLGVAQFAG